MAQTDAAPRDEVPGPVDPAADTVHEGDVVPSLNKSESGAERTSMGAERTSLGADRTSMGEKWGSTIKKVKLQVRGGARLSGRLGCWPFQVGSRVVVRWRTGPRGALVLWASLVARLACNGSWWGSECPEWLPAQRLALTILLVCHVIHVPCLGALPAQVALSQGFHTLRSVHHRAAAAAQHGARARGCTCCPPASGCVVPCSVLLCAVLGRGRRRRA